jgi:chorismate dehydratase
MNLSPSPIAVRPRFGQISFLNSLPIVLPIERGCIHLDADFYNDEPAKLNAAINANQLDVSAVSSFYYLQNKSLVLVPGISISCIREVGSVFLFSKIDPSQLGNSIIQVPKTSATSVALLKVLLAEKYSISPQFITEPRHNKTDASCLFGDEALQAETSWSNEYQRYDLGTWWHELTDLPMVFGLWVATKAWCANNPQSISGLSSALRNAVAIGLGEKFEEVLSEAHKRSGISIDRLTTYYKGQLSFDLSDKHLNGLNTFRDLCLKHHLLS